MKPRISIPRKKKNPLLQTLPLLLTVGFVLIFGFYLFTVIAFPTIFGDCVAVVNVNGPLTTETISSTLFSDSVPGSEDIAEQIAELDSRPDISSIVFVINSPGGSVVASREIYSSISSLSKPSVSYFKEVAASGGYYISTPTDYIISEPYAITGSIGVITPTFDASGLYGLVGVNITSIKSGSHKDMGSDSRPLTEEEKAILQSMIDAVFEDFKSVILENRKDKLNMVKFTEVLDGRIMLGLTAKEVGLIDAVGSKQDAIKKAADLAGMEEDPRVCEIELGIKEKGLFDMTSFINALVLSTNNYGFKYSLQ